MCEKMCSHSDADKTHLALQMRFTAFNTVVATRYALCIKYNHYAQPQKGVTKVATNDMAIPLPFPKSSKSASSKIAKLIIKTGSNAHSKFMENIHKTTSHLLISAIEKCIYKI